MHFCHVRHLLGKLSVRFFRSLVGFISIHRHAFAQLIELCFILVFQLLQTFVHSSCFTTSLCICLLQLALVFSHHELVSRFGVLGVRFNLRLVARTESVEKIFEVCLSLLLAFCCCCYIGRHGFTHTRNLCLVVRLHLGHSCFCVARFGFSPGSQSRLQLIQL